MKTGNKKLEAAVHYICNKCEDSSKLGATKLNKVLFFADLALYIETGKTLTGATYKKLQHGPVPTHVVAAIRQLEKDGKISKKSVDCYSYRKTEYNSLQEPSLTALEKDEINLLSVVIDDICDNHTAASVSEITHDFVWDAAIMGEEIPLGAYIVAKADKIDKEDMDWADGVIANL